MMPLFTLLLTLTAAGVFGLLARVRMNMKAAASLGARTPAGAERYRVMLRLLTEEPLDVSQRRAFRARRRAIFRGYLRSLTRDYACLLSGLRTVMVESKTDRPDLDQAIRESRRAFTLGMIRIEIGLWRHAADMGTVELSGLMSAMDRLRTFTASTAIAG